MPTLTPKLQIPLPTGSETASRLNTVVNPFTAVDQNAAAQSQVDQPFFLKSVTYDSANSRLVLTLGPGPAAFLETLVAPTTDTVYYIPAATASTVYTVYVKSDGTFLNNTTGAGTAGAVPIWRVTTGTVISTITTTDLRGRLPGAGARAVQDHLDTHGLSHQTHGAGAGQYVTLTTRADQAPSWPDIPDKPGQFPPSAHTHPWSDVTNPPATYAPSAHVATHRTGGSDALTAGDIGAVSKGGDAMTGLLTLSGDPTTALHAVTKQYADALKAGLITKDPVRLVTTGALPANTYAGGVLTGAANGTLPAQDGVVPGVNDRLLVKDEATGTNNGIYTVTDPGSSTTPWRLTRATDADTSTEVRAGLYVMVTEGTTYHDTGFVLGTNDPITLGTTPLTFTWYASVTQLVAGPGLSKTGNQVAVDFPAAGGTNGSATQPSRSDHSHTASATANTPAGNVASTDVQSAINELDTEKVGRGASNQTIEQLLSFIVPTDTRSWTATTWSATYPDKATHIDVKDGATVVAAIDITYNTDGNVTQYKLVAGGKTVTWTHTWTGTKWTGESKTVV